MGKSHFKCTECKRTYTIHEFHDTVNKEYLSSKCIYCQANTTKNDITTQYCKRCKHDRPSTDFFNHLNKPVKTCTYCRTKDQGRKPKTVKVTIIPEKPIEH